MQLISTTDSVASLLKKQLNEMKGIKYIETLKLTFKIATIDADKNEPKTIFETAYFNSKAKTINNQNEVNESIKPRDIKWNLSLVVRWFRMDCRISR